MANNYTDYAETLVTNFVFNTETATRPTAWWVALHVGNPTDAGTANEISTAGGTLYGRVAVVFDPASSGATQNAGDVVFGPAGTAWGTVDYVSVWTAETSGNALIAGALTTPKTVGVGDTLTIAAGDLDISTL